MRAVLEKALTIADLLDQLGGIPANRVRLRPPPGTATEQDVVTIHDRENRLCELVDGVLVEKAMGYYEARVAAVLIYFLEAYLEKHDLGFVMGADATLRLRPGLVRMPDVSFVSWDRIPDRQLPPEAIPDLVPDLAVEVLSESNTAAEIKRKLREYFRAGARLVWVVEPDERTIRVYTSPRRSRLVTEDQTLTGGSVLPGFALAVRQFFDRIGRRRGRR